MINKKQNKKAEGLQTTIVYILLGLVAAGFVMFIFDSRIGDIFKDEFSNLLGNEDKCSETGVTLEEYNNHLFRNLLNTEEETPNNQIVSYYKEFRTCFDFKDVKIETDEEAIKLADIMCYGGEFTYATEIYDELETSTSSIESDCQELKDIKLEYAKGNYEDAAELANEFKEQNPDVTMKSGNIAFAWKLFLAEVLASDDAYLKSSFDLYDHIYNYYDYGAEQYGFIFNFGKNIIQGKIQNIYAKMIAKKFYLSNHMNQGTYTFCFKSDEYTEDLYFSQIKEYYETEFEEELNINDITLNKEINQDNSDYYHCQRTDVIQCLYSSEAQFPTNNCVDIIELI